MGIPVSFDVTQTGVGTTDWLPLNRWGSAMTLVSAEVTGTATYSVEATTTNILRGATPTPAEATALEGFNALTATATGTQNVLYRALRLNVTSGTGSVRLRIQSGVTVPDAVTLFTPLSLFSSGEQGAWYDPSDLTTLYQDSAGTTPVTGDGQPVGLMLDKSGNGNDASQSTASLKPIYRTDGTLHWLEFDGVDDYMGAEGHGYTDKVTMSASYSNRVGVNGPMVGGSSLESPLQRNASVWPRVSDSSISLASTLNEKSVFVGLYDFSLNQYAVYLDGILDVSDTIARTVPGAFDQWIGRWSSEYFSGDLHNVVIAGVALDENKRANLDRYMAKKAGVTL